MLSTSMARSVVACVVDAGAVVGLDAEDDAVGLRYSRLGVTSDSMEALRLCLIARLASGAAVDDGDAQSRGGRAGLVHPLRVVGGLLDGQSAPAGTPR